MSSVRSVMMSTLPTISEFRKSLDKDQVFVDSFNLFLNLPVFTNRLRYLKETHTFNVSPYPNSKLLDFHQSNVLQWAYTHRLPLFWESEIYYGYRLGHLLFNPLSEELQNDTDVIEYISTHPSTKEIPKFLLFLKGSFGEAYCLYWLDIERLKHSSHFGQQKELVERIKRLYLRNGAPFEFDPSIRKTIYFTSCEARSIPEEISIFTDSQSQVEPMIKQYWFHSYIRQAVKHDRMGLSNDERSDSDGEGEGELSSHGVIVDEGNDKDTHHNGKEGMIIEREPMFVAPEQHNDIIDQPLLKAEPLLPSSELFDSTKESFVSGMEPQIITSFMQACIRCNFAAGNPILTFFNETLQNRDKLIDDPANLMLFWLSVELLLTKDEMRRWHNTVKSPQFDSDCPYFSLFHEYPLATELDSLLELFIDDNAEFFVKLPKATQSQLHLLIPKGLGKGLLLETQEYVCKKLQPFWEDYIVHENDLFQSECVEIKDMTHLSHQIQRHQSKLYHESQTLNNMLRNSFDPRNKLEIKRIWSAVEFTEAMVNPGLLHLPSRLSMQIYTNPLILFEARKSIQMERSFGASTPGDMGPITYKGLNLIPIVTTVSTKIKRTAFKMIRTTIYSSQPMTVTSKLIKKPSIPSSFADMMKSTDHIECFYNFLASNGNGAEMGLVFWLAIEDMKDSIGDPNNCRTKMRRIMRRFFKDGIDMTMYCKDSRIVDLSMATDPDPFLLMDAQEVMFKTLEIAWYQQYLLYLGDHRTSDDGKRTGFEKRPRIQTRRTVGKGQTKQLWSLFTKKVNGFRRGLKNPKVLPMFKKYLVQEVMRGDGVEKKKWMGKRIVNVTKLLNDLSFWAEVERYKDIADVVRAAKNSGTYTPEDEIMVYKKAHAIVNCYIDSTASPKVQINIPPEIVSLILERLTSKDVGRGLFHEAIVSVFSILILYWKRFCVWRWTPNRTGTRVANANNSTFSITDALNPQDSEDMLGGCILSFSLRKGLRLIIPPTQQIQYPVKNIYSKVQVYKIQSARAMISKHISRITSVQ